MTTNTAGIPEFSAFDYIPRTMACIFGTITNAICIAVFLNPKMKDISFKYMLAQSVSDLYLFLLLFSPLYFCLTNEISFAVQLYFMILDNYLI